MHNECGDEACVQLPIRLPCHLTDVELVFNKEQVDHLGSEIVVYSLQSVIAYDHFWQLDLVVDKDIKHVVVSPILLIERHAKVEELLQQVHVLLLQSVFKHHLS